MALAREASTMVLPPVMALVGSGQGQLAVLTDSPPFRSLSVSDRPTRHIWTLVNRKHLDGL